MTTQSAKAAKVQFLHDNLNPGEVYAGLILGQGSDPDYHLILLPTEAEKLNWKAAIAWAKKAGGALPDRREQRLLWINAKEHFKPDWYWSGQQSEGGAGCAWCQFFNGGYQNSGHVFSSLRARAVRRLIIE